MKIKNVVFSEGLTGFYFDDKQAIKQGAYEENGLVYDGTPLTPGFTAIRQPGQSLSIQIVLENGLVAYGDCAAVQYSGAGGRDPLFIASQYIPLLRERVQPFLQNRELTEFRSLAHECDTMLDSQGKPLHTALRYGVTQAILHAVSLSQGLTMAEVIAREYGLELKAEPVKIFSQSGDDRKLNADRMIVKEVDILPHGLFNSVRKLGAKGELLREYLVWLKRRVRELRPDPAYTPDFHVDVYGTIGDAFNHNIAAIGDYAAELARLVAPHQLLIEGPVDMDSANQHIETMASLRDYVDQRAIPVLFVADEWCNTLEDVRTFAEARAGHVLQIKTPDLGGINNSIEAVLHSRDHGSIPYLGGSCNETERSAQITVHMAVATQPRQILSKPGMGVDEGLAICKNEMNRLVEILRSRNR